MMEPLPNDPITSIQRAVDIVIENRCFGAAVILLFAGIDAMGNLNRPESRNFSTAEDFKEWVRRYFHVEGETAVTPEEWWAARNAIIHTFGTYSRAHQTQGVRALAWMVGSRPYVRYNPQVKPGLVLVDILGMREALFGGMERFVAEYSADAARRPIMEGRIRQMVMTYPV